MSTEVLMKGLLAAVISGAFAFAVLSRYDSEIGSENVETEHQRYLPYVSGALLPLFIVVCVGLALAYYGGKAAAQMAMSLCFGIFLHISLYYALLMIILPTLRRHFSARACATLWMLPNYLYITSFMKVPMPLLVVQTPDNLVWILFGVWASGGAGVLIWKMISHLIFRFRVLKNAAPVTDPEVLAIWNHEIAHAQFQKPKFRLVTSPGVVTPLSIGLFRRGLRVVLPERTYSPEELSLVFRHEIVHIGREDAWSKFFLVFCTAMCWFNPLMWMAMRKSADDLELSCDETVLIGCDDGVRYQYANLLLNTAGDERGFTTCLSATASAMRYRLKNAVKPTKKHSGALLVGLVFFALCMSCGYVALAYDAGTGAEVIYQSQDISEYRLSHIALKDDPYNTAWMCPDQEAFHAYMSSLKLSNLTGSYTFEDGGREFIFLYDTPKGELAVILGDSVMKTVPLYGDADAGKWYYLQGGADWARLSEFIIPGPALNLCVQGSDSACSEQIGATLCKLDRTENGRTTQLISLNMQEHGAPSGVFGREASKVTMDFSCELISDFRVEVESLDGKNRYTLSQSELEDPYVLPLADFSARYTVYAELRGENGWLYDAVFCFAFGDTE